MRQSKFLLSGSVNNIIQFGQKVVWCTLCSKQIIGPFISEDIKDNAVNVNGKQYRTMIREFLQVQQKLLGH